MIQFLYAAVLGILLAVIYEKSRTLLAPVLAHMAVNLWAIYSGDCIRGLSSLTGGAETIVLIAEAGRGGGVPGSAGARGAAACLKEEKGSINICEGYKRESASCCKRCKGYCFINYRTVLNRRRGGGEFSRHFSRILQKSTGKVLVSRGFLCYNLHVA